MTSSGHTGERAIHSSDFSAFTKRPHSPFVVAISYPCNYPFALRRLPQWNFVSPRGEVPWSFVAIFRRARVSSLAKTHTVSVFCAWVSHACEAVYGTSNCKICDDFRLITLRSRLEDYERESSKFSRRASSTSAPPREIAASLVEPRAGVRMSSSRRWRVSRQASPFLSRARTCEFAGRIFA